MRTFFKSGRYLFWVAAIMMIAAAAKLTQGVSPDDEPAISIAIFIAGVLIWIRARIKEARFKQQEEKML